MAYHSLVCMEVMNDKRGQNVVSIYVFETTSSR